VVPVLGVLTTRKVWPFLYLRRSIGEFLSPERVLEGLRKVGFNGLEAQPLNGGIAVLYTGVKP
jgi:ubiquinone/menaquinone biosynthesis C-methylase UbiE